MRTKKDPSGQFWKEKTLKEMSRNEWESLCDGCGQCCLVKIEDEETDEIFITNVACHLLDLDSCQCLDYSHRSERVPSCLVLQPDKEHLYRFLPVTCAYRCLHEGRGLPDWHPLLTGDRQSVQLAGISVKAYAISEQYIHPEQLEEHVIEQIPGLKE